MTRKILVPIDIENPEKVINDFLFPNQTENGFVLTGIKTGKKSNFGMVVMTSEINESDILKKINDSKIKISTNQSLLNDLKIYVEKMPNYKIGNIIEIDNSDSGLEFKIKYQRLTRR